MTKTTALAWKEWRESSPFLWTALGIFVGLPMIGAMEHMSRFRHVYTALPWMVLFGAALPVFVAVAVTSRDLGRPVEDFWRSRPTTATRWMIVKFAVGLAVVLASCLIPLAVERAVDLYRYEQSAIIWLPISWIVIYTLSFLIGCIIQRPAHSTVIAATALLLIYLLPMVLPPLQGVITLPWYIQGNLGVRFASRLLLVSLAFAVLAIVFVQRRWRIEPGPKFMYGSICTALMIFLATTGYRLGSNLPVLQQIDLPPHQYADRILRVADQLYVNVVEYDRNANINSVVVRKLSVTSTGIELSQQAWIPFWPYLRNSVQCAQPNQDVSYAIDDSGKLGSILLKVVLEIHPTQSNVIATIPIEWKIPPGRYQAIAPSPHLFLWKDRLYLIGYNLAVLDVSTPRSPRLLSVTRLRFPERDDQATWNPGVLVETTSDGVMWNLPVVNGLPDMERLKAAIQTYPIANWAFDGQILCEFGSGYISEFRLSKLTGTHATFTRVGRINPNVLDDFFGYEWSRDPHFDHGLLYLTQGYGGELNQRIGIYDTTGPQAPKLIAHFAAPGGPISAYPLPDGRCIVAGSKIWLLGPPPRR